MEATVSLVINVYSACLEHCSVEGRQQRPHPSVQLLPLLLPVGQLPHHCSESAAQCSHQGGDGAAPRSSRPDAIEILGIDIDNLDDLRSIYHKKTTREEFFLLYELGGTTVYVVYTSG